ncbi:hypothetical protein OG244_04615 [Streptomyces brevispora]|uniref:hypothetical protein n=1 Tax=Streptomyces brevispora TaxID=887462 RepID=UPI002E2FC95C|nr:hypothetical protein [Streptomyces brevispora]
MNILNVVLGALCLLLTFLVFARSRGISDPVAWAATAILVIGGVVLPRLLHDTAGCWLLLNLLSLVALFSLARQQRRR